jgi:hypothetical protein
VTVFTYAPGIFPIVRVASYVAKLVDPNEPARFSLRQKIFVACTKLSIYVQFFPDHFLLTICNFLLTISNFLLTVIHMIIAPAFASLCVTTTLRGIACYLLFHFLTITSVWPDRPSGPAGTLVDLFSIGIQVSVSRLCPLSKQDDPFTLFRMTNGLQRAYVVHP